MIDKLTELKQKSDMDKILEWLSNYGSEYDVKNQILYIRKPMSVINFVALKKILNKYTKVKDIIIESEIKVWKIK